VRDFVLRVRLAIVSCLVLLILVNALISSCSKSTGTGTFPADAFPGTEAGGEGTGTAMTTGMATSACTITPEAKASPEVTWYEPSPLRPDEIAELPAGTLLETAPEGGTLAGCFYYEEISDEVFSRMKGNSYKDDCDVPLADLRYVRVLYRDFDGNARIGELVVNRLIADDVLEIFRGLYDADYRIGKMVLIDEYGGDDNLSMADNNTSSFNYRIVNHSTVLSRHAYGLAIDLNPLYNPWIYEKDGETITDPPSGAAYADRMLDLPYLIDHEDLAYQLFTEHGFKWGGDWDGSKDYQHFSYTP
jgi:hypothetical protein